MKQSNSRVLFFNLITKQDNDYTDVDILDMRNELMHLLGEEDFEWFDACGGQCAFKDGDLKLFRSVCRDFSSKFGIPIFAARIIDPGVGLFPDEIDDRFLLGPVE